MLFLVVALSAALNLAVCILIVCWRANDELEAALAVRDRTIAHLRKCLERVEDATK